MACPDDASVTAAAHATPKSGDTPRYPRRPPAAGALIKTILRTQLACGPHQHLAAALVAGPAALASLAAHGLAPAAATHLEAKTDVFERFIADPAAAIARRKALTAALHPKFREVGKLLVKMDRLVLRFRRSEAGTLFAAT